MNPRSTDCKADALTITPLIAILHTLVIVMFNLREALEIMQAVYDLAQYNETEAQIKCYGAGNLFRVKKYWYGYNT